MLYRGKTALITGASSGIGAAFAEALAARGCDIVLVARSSGALTTLADRLKSRHGVQTTVITQDLAAPMAAETVREATDWLGLRVDILVNSAGFGSAGEFHTIADGRVVHEVAVDVVALVELTHAYLPDMVARRDGAVVNVASTAAFQPLPYLAVYGASKAFVLSFSQALWAEYRARGVRVLAVCPGPVKTNFLTAMGSAEAGRRSGLGRPSTPQAVVDAALRALDRGRFTVTPGLANAALPVLGRLLPRRLQLAVAERLYRGVHGDTGVPAPTTKEVAR
jgi:hypothetical protein